MKLEFCRHIVEKYLFMKFDENPFSGVKLFRAKRRTNGGTDVVKLIITFAIFRTPIIKVVWGFNNNRRQKTWTFGRFAMCQTCRVLEPWESKVMGSSLICSNYTHIRLSEKRLLKSLLLPACVWKISHIQKEWTGYHRLWYWTISSKIAKLLF